METTEIILRDDGSLSRRVIREQALAAGPEVLAALTSEVRRPVRDVHQFPDWGAVHADIGDQDVLWTVRIDKIPLHARYRLADGVLVPAFSSVTDLELPLVWQSPPEVRLAFCVRTHQHHATPQVDGNWLFACDREQRGYRLPLPNLHDDCLLCAGEFQDRHATALQAVAASLEQFRQSKWNSDLLRTPECTQQFFRFKPEDEGFTPLPIAAADWTTLCDKVSTAVMERVVL